MIRLLWSWLMITTDPRKILYSAPGNGFPTCISIPKLSLYFIAPPPATVLMRNMYLHHVENHFIYFIYLIYFVHKNRKHPQLLTPCFNGRLLTDQSEKQFSYTDKIVFPVILWLLSVKYWKCMETVFKVLHNIAIIVNLSRPLSWFPSRHFCNSQWTANCMSSCLCMVGEGA